MQITQTTERFMQTHLPKPNPWYVAGDIGPYVNAKKKTGHIYFNQGAISTLNGSPLKLVDKFTYLGSSISSTEIFV